MFWDGNALAFVPSFVVDSPFKEIADVVMDCLSPRLVMSATCRQHVGDKAKCCLLLSRQGKFGDMFSCVSAHFCVVMSRH